jgi:hypothetical protein
MLNRPTSQELDVTKSLRDDKNRLQEYVKRIVMEKPLSRTMLPTAHSAIRAVGSQYATKINEM